MYIFNGVATLHEREYRWKKNIWFGFRVADKVPPIELRAPNNSRCITQYVEALFSSS